MRSRPEPGRAVSEFPRKAPGVDVGRSWRTVWMPRDDVRQRMQGYLQGVCVMKKVASLILVAAVAVMVSTPSLAQDAPRGMGKNMPTFEDFDLDGDGRITEEEFNKLRSERIARHAEEGRPMKNMANAPSFADIDTNADGGVSREELGAHQADHMKKMMDAKQDGKQ